MRLPDLDKILSAMLHTHPGISDLNFSVGHPLQVESFGELKPALIDPPIDILTPVQTERIALALKNQGGSLQLLQMRGTQAGRRARRVKRISEANEAVHFFFERHMTADASAHALADQDR